MAFNSFNFWLIFPFIFVIYWAVPKRYYLHFREDQKTDEFIEIEIGSEDILNQLENVMENGTDLPE